MCLSESMKEILTIIIACLLPAMGLKCASGAPSVAYYTATDKGESAAVFFAAGKFSDAIKAYRIALREALAMDQPELQARYNFNIGRIYYECAAYDSALSLFSQAKAFFEETGRKAEAAVAEVYIILTKAYTGESDSVEALFQSLEPFLKRDDEPLLKTARSITALLRNDADAAMKHCKSALEPFRLQKNYYGCGVVYYYMAVASSMRREVEKTRNYLDSSLICYRRSPQRYRTWKTLLGRAILEYGKGDTAEGDKWYYRAEAAAPDMITLPSRDSLCAGNYMQKP